MLIIQMLRVENVSEENINPQPNILISYTVLYKPQTVYRIEVDVESKVNLVKFPRLLIILVIPIILIIMPAESQLLPNPIPKSFLGK